MKTPDIVGLGRIECGVADIALVIEDQFRLSVTRDISPHGRLVAHHRIRQVSRPMAALGAGVFVPITLRAGKRHRENVQPAIPIEVGGVGQKIVRVIFWIKDRGGTQFVFRFEIRPFKPERTRHHIHRSVLVEVAERRAFRVEQVGQAQLLKGIALRQHSGHRHRSRLGRGRGDWQLGSALRFDAQTRDGQAVGAHDSGAGHPTTATLGDFEPELVGSFLEINQSHVLVRHHAAVNVVAENQRAIQPGFHAVVAPEQQRRLAVLRRNDLRLEIRCTIVLVGEKHPQVRVIAARQGLPSHGLTRFLGTEFDVEDSFRSGGSRLTIGTADQPILNERRGDVRLAAQRPGPLEGVGRLTVSQHLDGRFVCELRVRSGEFFGNAHRR